MKAIYIAKGLSLKSNKDKIVLSYKDSVIHSWENNYMNELTLQSSANKLKKSVIKSQFTNMEEYTIGGNNDVKTIFLICKEDNGYKYKRSVSILIDSFSPRFVEI